MQYLFPHACFECRRSFKRERDQENDYRKCPHCGGQAIRLSRKFKAPPTADTKQWEKVRQLVAAGFRFQSDYKMDAHLGYLVEVPYPKTIREVAPFIELHTPKKLH